MALTEKQREALIKWLESMPWWKELPYGKLAAENERYRIACQHAVDHHETYVDESGVIVITLYSYALIKKALGGE